MVIFFYSSLQAAEPITFSNIKSRIKDIPEVAYNNTQNLLNSNRAKSNSVKLEIHVGPNTKLYFKDNEKYFKYGIALWANFKQPSKYGALFYSFKDKSWAASQYEKIIGRPDDGLIDAPCHNKRCSGANSGMENNVDIGLKYQGQGRAVICFDSDDDGDIDILLSLVDSPVKSIQATGLSILTDSLDIAHARIRFGNGTVASIMSSRVAKDEVRKVKLFQKSLYATIDLLLGLAEVYKIVGDPKDDPNALMTVPFEYNGAKRFIAYDKPAMSEQDALGMELHNFIKSVQGKETPIVSGEAGRDALKIAIKIQQMITQDIH